MVWLFVLGLVGLAFWATRRTGTAANEQQASAGDINRQWIEFLVGYYQVAKNKNERAVITRMLQDLSSQGMPVTAAQLSLVADGQAAPAATTVDRVLNYEVQAAESYQAASQSDAAPKRADVQLDNVSLLLYFGAFLFVASAGLFVAFGSASGVVRACIVLLVMLCMYAGGIWLYRSRPQLKQAGQAFAGIGIVLAPVVGGAWYNYVLGAGSGPAVWLGTSVLCLGLYAHALRVFRNTLMSYILVFTFLSLFESCIGVTHAPLYYYGWGIAVVGLLLQFAARRWQGWQELGESSRLSSQLLLPVSVLASLALIGQDGTLQLGVSLLLAAIFYVFEFTRTSGPLRETNASVSQLTALSSVASFGYAFNRSWTDMAIALVVVNALQAALLIAVGKRGKLWYNFGSGVLITAIAAVLVSVQNGGYLLVALLAAVVVAAIIWLRQQRGEAYMAAALAWAALPYVYGQLTLVPHISLITQTVIAGLSLLVVWVTQCLKQPKIAEWESYASSSYGIITTALLICAALAGPGVALAAGTAISLSMVGLAEIRGRLEWTEVATVVLTLTALRAWESRPAFLAAVLFSLVYGVLAALRYHRELLRWFGTFAWLVLPVALAHAHVFVRWTPATFTWAYMLVMVGLLLSRGIARGVWFVSDKIPLASYARTASLSYVTGYGLAASTSLCFSLVATNSRLQTSLVLVALSLTVLVVARKIEKRTDILLLLPILAQALLVSAIRPSRIGRQLDGFILLSSSVAAISYALTTELEAIGKKVLEARQTSLAMAFVAPATVVYASAGHSWPMPLGLLVAGLICSHYTRHAIQSTRELTGAICTLAIAWFMYAFGVQAVQAYTHLAVANLGLYAYLRTVRGEHEIADQYLWWMLGTATIPLAIQALGQGGSVYGLWLLLEEVAIMLFGMAIGKSFVTRWGLYTAVAAVLYQLRGLGYGALALLALFLIGLAVYQLQKHGSDKPG